MAVALDAMVAEVVAAHVDEIEAERCLPAVVVDALRRSGLNRMAIPAALGGTEARVVDTVEAVAAIAAVDGSTGWCAGIGAGSNVFAGYLPEEGAREVFADPDQGNATMFAPSGVVSVGAAARGPGAGGGPGGVGGTGANGSRGGRLGRLDGRWAFTSNCLHSAWAGLGAIVEHDGTPEPAPRVVFVPVADLTIEDTWTAQGLRGTGSHHVAASNLEVDLVHSCRFTDRAWPDGPLWRLPIYTVLIPVLAAVPLGIARGAV